MAIGMVVLILLLGSALLMATRQQLSASLALVADERQHLIDYHQALSAQAWGARLDWPSRHGWQCRQQAGFHWQACLLQRDDEQALLRAAPSGPHSEVLALWQWMRPVSETRWRAVAGGWIDYCPLATPVECVPDAS